MVTENIFELDERWKVKSAVQCLKDRINKELSVDEYSDAGYIVNCIIDDAFKGLVDEE